MELGAAEPKTIKLTSNFRNHDGAVYSPSGDHILFMTEPDVRATSRSRRRQVRDLGDEAGWQPESALS